MRINITYTTADFNVEDYNSCIEIDEVKTVGPEDGLHCTCYKFDVIKTGFGTSNYCEARPCEVKTLNEGGTYSFNRGMTDRFQAEIFEDLDGIPHKGEGLIINLWSLDEEAIRKMLVPTQWSYQNTVYNRTRISDMIMVADTLGYEYVQIYVNYDVFKTYSEALFDSAPELLGVTIQEE